LTYEVKDRQSPVAGWLGATFPQYKEIQSEFRVAAGVQQVLMPAGVVPGTQGAAIDFWLRMLVDPLPSIALPLMGLLSGRAPCLRAGRELLRELAAGEHPRKTANGAVELRMVGAGLLRLGAAGGVVSGGVGGALPADAPKRVQWRGGSTRVGQRGGSGRPDRDAGSGG